MAKYVEDSLEEFVVSFNQARFEADAHAELTARLGAGEALGELQQTLRAFNNTAARKRAAEGGADGSRLLRLPRTVYGDGGACKPTVTFGAIMGASPGGGRDSSSQRSQTPPPSGRKQVGSGELWHSGGCFVYDVTAAKAEMHRLGGGNRCVHAMLCGGAPDHAIKKFGTNKCPLFGQPGHMGYGSEGTGKHAPLDGFVASTFRCNQFKSVDSNGQGVRQ